MYFVFLMSCIATCTVSSIVVHDIKITSEITRKCRFYFPDTMFDDFKIICLAGLPKGYIKFLRQTMSILDSRIALITLNR